MELEEERRFHFQDGTSVQNLEELKGKIESISYDEFYSHVNEEKNDFAAWIEGVLEQAELANKLRAVSSIVESVEILNEALYPDAAKGDDLQVRIEEQLFSQQPEMGETLDADAPQPEPAPEVHEADWDKEMQSAEGVEFETPSESVLPSKEDLEAARTPGEPVTTTDPGHVPITEKVDKPVTHAEHMHFLVKQFVFGFLIGLILGVILGRVISIFV